MIQSRKNKAAKGMWLRPLALAVAKWSSHCWQKLSHSIWDLPQYTSDDLAFKSFSQGLSEAGTWTSKTTFRICCRSSLVYLAIKDLTDQALGSTIGLAASFESDPADSEGLEGALVMHSLCRAVMSSYWSHPGSKDGAEWGES